MISIQSLEGTVEKHNAVLINQEICTGCGQCVLVCPTKSLSLVGGKARMTSLESISCGHCEAVCPVNAVRVPLLDDDMGNCETFLFEKRWLRPGHFDLSRLVQLMASRRSCRNYTAQPVERAALEDLVKIGVTAPSGTNSQLWTFTILPTRKAVERLIPVIVGFYSHLNTKAKKAVVRRGLKLIGKGELDEYYRLYYRQIRDGLAEWEKTGKDRLFHGATAAIIVGSKPGASCPAEDALLATQNILLAAHAMGLGTCLVGFAVAAMKNDPKVQLAAGIPGGETVYAVIAVGHPDETYLKVARRKKVALRYFEGE